MGEEKWNILWPKKQWWYSQRGPEMDPKKLLHLSLIMHTSIESNSRSIYFFNRKKIAVFEGRMGYILSWEIGTGENIEKGNGEIQEGMCFLWK